MNKIKAVAAVFILIVFYGCSSVSSIYDVMPEVRNDPFEPKIESESLRFYTAGQTGIEKKNRVYSTSFREGSVDWMWYELIVRNLSDKDTKLAYREVWLDENDAIISSETKTMSVKKKDVYLEFSAGIQTNWEPGYYVLRIFQDSLKLDEKEFKIIKLK